MKRPGPKLLVPVAVLAVGALGVIALAATREKPETQSPIVTGPLVRVVEAQPQSWRYRVRTHGTVTPRTESELVPQVSGEVIWVSPDLVSGGFFQAGEPLLRIDPHDTEVELESARAAVARSRSEFGRARTELERQRKLEAQGAASKARIDDAENADRVAAAVLAESRARLSRAERDLARAELVAPFEGRVRSERVDVGQFATRGQALGMLYAVDWAEVRLPIPDRELLFVDVPLGAPSREDDSVEPSGPAVELRAEFAGSEHTWTGVIVRTEGEIDSRSRMLTVVARVESPYEVGAGRPPLAVGLFVEAEIRGREVQGVYVLPSAALRRGDPMEAGARDAVHVVDAEGRLHIREVELLRSERDRVVIGKGLSPGDRVSVSPLQTAVDGMLVRVFGDEKGLPAEPAPPEQRATAAGTSS